MLGSFPADAFNFTSDLTWDRSGRMVPGIPWDGIWYPVAKWMGVEEPQLSEMLPNAKNFAMG